RCCAHTEVLRSFNVCAREVSGNARQARTTTGAKANGGNRHVISHLLSIFGRPSLSITITTETAISRNWSGGSRFASLLIADRRAFLNESITRWSVSRGKLGKKSV